MLTVEDGTGLATADSYLSVADADVWHAGRNTSAWLAASFAAKEAALREATSYQDGTYVWRGLISVSTQALGWPREGVYDDEGREIASDAVPAKVEAATAYLAGQALSKSLQPAGGGASKIRSKRVASLRIEYFEGADAARRDFREANALLKGLYKYTPGGISGRAVRWS